MDQLLFTIQQVSADLQAPKLTVTESKGFQFDQILDGAKSIFGADTLNPLPQLFDIISGVSMVIRENARVDEFDTLVLERSKETLWVPDTAVQTEDAKPGSALGAGLVLLEEHCLWRGNTRR